MPFRMAETEGVAVVKVIGVGGGGGNAINTMVDDRLQGVEFITANTDRQALNQSRADICLQIGPNITKGLGAGADPETGELAAQESLDEIKESLKGADMVFVAAGLGGGTGTGAAPIVAKISKELGALTVAVVTKPFHFEGKARMRNAERGWDQLRKYADTIITVPNDRLLSLMQKNSKLSDMLSMADKVLLQAVKGITDLINVPGMINADFADLRTVMREVGPAIMGSGSAVGESRATEAAKRAIDNQLLEDVGIDGARGLLINISASKESFTMAEFMEVSALIHAKVDDEAKVVIGALYNDALGDELHVTVIATGVGEVVPTKEKLVQVELSAKSKGSIPEEQAERPVHTSPAPANPQARKSIFSSSNFNGFENHGISSGEKSRNKQESQIWNEEYMETPTYLRKKAN
ncbi:MAG: cell division protein FtsZ [Proteobacteria bacterium]|nr:cell division protein FtsZ [Pseudomonadota bacterium]MBU1060310.1 cell division protein FtsZ [Pseudomonadota bacterium]